MMQSDNVTQAWLEDETGKPVEKIDVPARPVPDVVERDGTYYYRIRATMPVFRARSSKPPADTLLALTPPELLEVLRALGAPCSLLAWLGEEAAARAEGVTAGSPRTLAQLWEGSPRADWLLWLVLEADLLGSSLHRRAVQLACDFVRETLVQVRDEERQLGSRLLLVLAESWSLDPSHSWGREMDEVPDAYTDPALAAYRLARHGAGEDNFEDALDVAATPEASLACVRACRIRDRITLREVATSMARLEKVSRLLYPEVHSSLSA